jgi:tetratricopeptide (TPR) repeat protein
MPEDDIEGGPSTIAGSAAAIALALDEARANSALTEDARILLREQADVLRLQKERLLREEGSFAEEQRLQLAHLRLRRFSDYSKMALEITFGLFLLVVVAGFGVLVWNAAHANGLIIESFSVPPDLANRGLTGQALASQMLDKLIAMQNATQSDRPAQTYANNWGDDIKVQIPDTGVSIGELSRFLRQWLGHETHISGEVFRDAKGITLLARIGNSGSARVSGPETDLDALLQKTAEAVYAHTQPYRYAIYEIYSGNWRDAKRIQTADTLSADPLERAFAWTGLGFVAMNYEHDMHEANADFWRSVREVPDFSFGWGDIEAYSELSLGHDEADLAASRKAALYEGRYMRPETARSFEAYDQVAIAEYLGDFASALRVNRDAAALHGSDFDDSAQVDLAFLHDRDAQARMSPGSRRQPFDVAAGLQNWRAILALEPQIEALLRKDGPGRDWDTIFGRYYRPWLALAKAKLGDGAGALTLIGTTPLDCYICVRFRGDIDTTLKRPGAAAYWFDIAVREAPSIPFAYADWGAMLLAKGDVDGAIAKFREANEKGPHFADALELWGEALIRKNRSDLALAKFADANKYAPNWGRLHLKWGEALSWSGNKADAKKQFAVASDLGLSAADKAALAKIMH